MKTQTCLKEFIDALRDGKQKTGSYPDEAFLKILGKLNKLFNELITLLILLLLIKTYDAFKVKEVLHNGVPVK